MFRHWCLLMLVGALVGCGASPAPGTLVTGSPSTEPKADEPRILDGHAKDIVRLVFSPDGRTLASTAFDDTKVKLWDVAGGQLLYSLPGPAWSAVFTADSKTLLMAAGKEIRVWDVATGKEQWPIERAAICLAISKNGKKLASAAIESNGKGYLWETTICDLPAFKEGNRFRGEGLIEDLTFAIDDNAIIAQTQSNGTLQTAVNSYAASTGELVKYLMSDVWCVALSPDGKELAVGGKEGQISIRDPNTGRQRSRIEVADRPSAEAAPEAFPLQFYGLAYSPDGKLLAAAIRDSVKVFEAETGKLLAELKSEAYTTGPVAFSPDGKILASGRREILFWDMPVYAARVNGQTK